MKFTPRLHLLSAGLFLAAVLPVCGSIALKLSPNSTTPSASAFEADYSSTHLYVDEINSDSIPITIFFDPGTTGVDEADVFTNLNNRDKANLDANHDGIPDGIVPPSGNSILAGDTNNYFTAYKMNLVSGGYQTTIYASKTGAYRLTARYHLTGDPATTWHYYGDFIDGNGLNFRDAAIVVGPTKARNMVMYEANAMNVDAENPSSDTDATQRSTFDDLYGGPHKTTTRPWNLSYVQGMGANWLWLQPIHPVGVEGRQTDPNTGQPFSVGSPYAVKNFFAVNPLFSKTYVPGTTPEATGRANALIEFQGFVSAADTAGINVMLDVPFNHTAFDCELGTYGAQLWAPTMSGTALMENTEARIYSRWTGGSLSQTDSANAADFNYGERAFSAASIALACDRFDFGKFIDVHDIYFGRYAALVDTSSNSGNYNNEGDWFDYSIGSEGVDGSGNGHFDTITQNAWKYFANYIPFWLQQTGHTDGSGNLQGNSTLSDPVARRAADDRGLDGIRADFAQGLPPQCWEYIINVARSYKWNFVFLAESLDGGHVTYRSSRHFDVLNENVIFDLYSASSTTNFRNIYDGRRSAYGQALVLWDTESHDEAGYADPFLALMRYAVNSTIDGVPDVFNGQEIGIAGAVVPPSTSPTASPYGFWNYQTNFGKSIPNFMLFNSMANAWNNLAPANYQSQIYPVYAGIGRARSASPALQSSNRYYLDALGGGTPASLFGVAKYANPNAYPNLSDVVFAFVNLNRDAGQSATFNVNITQNGSNLFGIDSARTYNVKNIAADDLTHDGARANTWLWGAGGRTGADVLTNGVFVSLNQVPAAIATWQTAPYEPQYLKLYDVTPPPAPGAPGTPKSYSIGNSATYTWNAAVDTEGGISGYQVVISTGTNGTGAILYSGTVSGTSVTGTGSYGQTTYATVRSVNNAGVASTSSSTSSAGTMLLDPAGDQDGDGVLNAAEDTAGTSPFDNADYFRIKSITPVAGGSQVTWASVPGMKYQVLLSTTALTSGYSPISSVMTAAAGQKTMSYSDTASTGARRYYRVTTVP